MTRQCTRLTCEACERSFALDGDGVVAATELDAFIAAHLYCGGTLRVVIEDRD